MQLNIDRQQSWQHKDCTSCYNSTRSPAQKRDFYNKRTELGNKYDSLKLERQELQLELKIKFLEKYGSLPTWWFEAE